MVTKHLNNSGILYLCFVLAKKLMVTKLSKKGKNSIYGFVLAKKLMVTKQFVHELLYDIQFCSSEKINGNKTN